ncbi:MAG: YebC/PmpR family DNA-binding transcriptional regulator [candidate division Zixibacteria bacterium]|nr:YebC/PmpR family DNA-binding transcriptional regulator [candidate division Zixibacteria bacterium]
MSGHSKWATIKRKKEKTDAERGKVFTKLIKELTIAARHGGGDPDGNPRLRSAILAAKNANMPATNIERAIKKGTGELPGVSYEEVNYEGYGPGGVAILVEVTTDNKNRTVSEIRNIFSKNGGNLGEVGCVGWMFEKRGLLNVDRKQIEEDKLLEMVLDAGAIDMRSEEDYYEIVTPYNLFEEVKQAVEKNKVSYSNAELTMLPQTTVKLEGKEAEQMIKLMQSLEEHDDVLKVYANFDIAEDIMERISAQL